MFGGLEDAQMTAALEALLFVSVEPVGTLALADMLQADPGQVEAALVALRADLAERQTGIQLQAVAGGWQLATHPAYHELLEHYVLSWDTRRLTQAAWETLAIIAYLQPVTRAGIAAVRGVNSDSSVNSLVDKGLVREAGAADTPGNPTLYATTRTFLEKFGLNSVRDLPPLEDFAPDQETAELLRQGLSAHAGAFAAVDAQQAAEAEHVGSETAAADAAAQVLDAAEFPEGMDESVASAMRSMLGDALAQSADVVEKIDFDDLDFEE